MQGTASSAPASVMEHSISITLDQPTASHSLIEELAVLAGSLRGYKKKEYDDQININILIIKITILNHF
jgi:hypothetical protein